MKNDYEVISLREHCPPELLEQYDQYHASGYSDSEFNSEHRDDNYVQYQLVLALEKCLNYPGSHVIFHCTNQRNVHYDLAKKYYMTFWPSERRMVFRDGSQIQYLFKDQDHCECECHWLNLCWRNHWHKSEN